MTSFAEHTYEIRALREDGIPLYIGYHVTREPLLLPTGTFTEGELYGTIARALGKERPVEKVHIAEVMRRGG